MMHGKSKENSEMERGMDVLREDMIDLKVGLLMYRVILMDKVNKQRDSDMNELKEVIVMNRLKISDIIPDDSIIDDYREGEGGGGRESDKKADCKIEEEIRDDEVFFEECENMIEVMEKQELEGRDGIDKMNKELKELEIKLEELKTRSINQADE